MHGNGKSKTENFGYSIDGVDIFVTGHNHTPISTFPSKIIIDAHNNQIREQPFYHVITSSFTKMGGYGLRANYAPQNNEIIPVIHLSGTEKKVRIEWK